MSEVVADAARTGAGTFGERPRGHAASGRVVIAQGRYNPHPGERSKIYKRLTVRAAAQPKRLAFVERDRGSLRGTGARPGAGSQQVELGRRVLVRLWGLRVDSRAGRRLGETQVR